MNHQSGPSRFRALFDAALREYEKTTNINLPNHPLAEKFQNSNSVKSVIAILQDQARQLGDFPGSSRIIKSINNAISTLYILSTTPAFGDAIDSVSPKDLWSISCLMCILQSFPPTKAIQTGLAILLAVCGLLVTPTSTHIEVH
jgi:hypothetical protein